MARRPVTCREKALELLARRSHFRRELERKLGQRGFVEEEVEETIARLEARGLVDDRRTAREFAESKLAREPMGGRRLRAELQRRGVSSEVAGEVLAELLPDDDRAPALEAGRRWRRRRPGGSRTSLARYLERRGFSRRAIFSALDELAGSDDADDL